MSRLLLFSCLFFVRVYAQIENALSEERLSDGKKITLVGDVVVEHSLGKISTHHLSVTPSSEKKLRDRYSLLEMSEQVKVELKDGGQLNCQFAKVELSKMKGIFVGNSEQPDVIYCNRGETLPHSSAKQLPPLEVRSGQMSLEFMRGQEASHGTLVKEIEATDNVRVDYDQTYQLLADRAHYHRLPTEQLSHLTGLLTLSMTGQQAACKVTNLNGDLLKAKTIQVDTINRQMSMVDSGGHLFLREKKETPQKLEFKADTLVWELPKETLHLQGNVEITHNGTLHVKTDRELTVSHTHKNGKRGLRSVHAPLQTEIFFLKGQNAPSRKIICPGPLFIDHEKQEMKLEGKNEQILLMDQLGEMYADHVQIKYRSENEQLEVQEIKLEGHVRLLNHYDSKLKEAGSVLQYALADSMEYFPVQKEIILKSTEDNRVLFFDQVNSVQISAPSLKIHYEKDSAHQSIKGEGDVRFTFVEKELDQIKQRFKFLEAAKDKSYDCAK